MAHAFFRSKGLWTGSPAVKTQLLQEIKTKDLGGKMSNDRREELRLGWNETFRFSELKYEERKGDLGVAL